MQDAVTRFRKGQCERQSCKEGTEEAESGEDEQSKQNNIDNIAISYSDPRDAIDQNMK